MRKRNGFTLIELLAIIVILAIIAVITVPIILNIIDNSKRGAAIDSAYGYRDAINKWYVSKMLDDNSYVIEDGEHDINYFVNLGVDVSGEKPSDGWVMIESDNVTDFSVKIGDYAVTYNSSTNSIDAVKGGEIVLTPKAQAMKDAREKVSAYIASVTTASNTKNYDEDKSFTVDEIVTELGVDKTTGFDDSSWVYFTYDSDASSNKMSVTNYSFKVTEDTSIFFLAVIVTEAFLLLAVVAVITALPSPLTLTLPLDTVATSVLLLSQVIARLIFALSGPRGDVSLKLSPT